MKGRRYPPAQCVDCGRFTRTLCIPCSMPLCDEHSTFPLCSDCELESSRQARIEEYERSRAEAEEEDRVRVEDDDRHTVPEERER